MTAISGFSLLGSSYGDVENRWWLQPKVTKPGEEAQKKSDTKSSQGAQEYVEVKSNSLKLMTPANGEDSATQEMPASQKSTAVRRGSSESKRSANSRRFSAAQDASPAVQNNSPAVKIASVEQPAPIVQRRNSDVKVHNSASSVAEQAASSQQSRVAKEASSPKQSNIAKLNYAAPTVAEQVAASQPSSAQATKQELPPKITVQSSAKKPVCTKKTDCLCSKSRRSAQKNSGLVPTNILLDKSPEVLVQRVYFLDWLKCLLNYSYDYTRPSPVPRRLRVEPFNPTEFYYPAALADAPKVERKAKGEKKVVFGGILTQLLSHRESYIPPTPVARKLKDETINSTEIVYPQAPEKEAETLFLNERYEKYRRPACELAEETVMGAIARVIPAPPKSEPCNASEVSSPVCAKNQTPVSVPCTATSASAPCTATSSQSTPAPCTVASCPSSETSASERPSAPVSESAASASVIKALTIKNANTPATAEISTAKPENDKADKAMIEKEPVMEAQMSNQASPEKAIIKQEAPLTKTWLERSGSHFGDIHSGRSDEAYEKHLERQREFPAKATKFILRKKKSNL
ncbi:MAG: hypothetical protein HQL32_08790 [Planctomycetes bacterium]|nr:hypothetical protein [Planctomycetota bacterium]